MATKTEWIALARRCEEAKGPDRIVDGLIYMALRPNPPVYCEVSATGLIWAWNSPPPHPAGTGNAWGRADEFTASLDASRDHIEREFPEADVASGKRGLGRGFATINDGGALARTEELACAAALCYAMAKKAEA
jgi:hypothetical protein